MTKLGPLTSQALGRSPYDAVVEGEGVADWSALDQRYDDHGRPINPITKRINRDIVRSHNEVMHVIGVAEPDSGILAADAEAERRLIQQRYEDQVGRQLMNMGRIMGIAGVWGVNAMRQRILLYRQYSEIPFRHLMTYGVDRRPISSVFTTGLPVFIANHSLRQASLTLDQIRTSFWSRSVIQFVRLHLQIFLCLQRMAIIPAYPWFPNPLYFVPFSSQSPISPPPPFPTTLSARGLALWTAQAALNIAPAAAFYGYTKLWTYVTQFIYGEVYLHLPKPTNYRMSRGNMHEHTVSSRRLATSTEEEQTNGVDATATGANAPLTNGFITDAPQVEEPGLMTDAEMEAMEPREPYPSQAQTPAPPASPTAVRRRNTVSSRGGDDGYGSEEEEFELSATLISFDVEAADASDLPNTWSAELRQSSAGPGAAGGGGMGGDDGYGGNGYPDEYFHSGSEPVYADNVLTRLPSVIATDVLTVVLSSALIAPYEAFVIRLVARAYRLRNGLPLDDLYGLGLVPFTGGSLNLTSLTNFVGVELVHLLIESWCWLFTTSLAILYRNSTPGMTFWQVLQANFRKFWYKAEEEQQ